MAGQNPMQQTDNEKLAVILQQVLKETRELKEDNKKLREKFEDASGIRELPISSPNGDKTQRKKRRSAPKECQVSINVIQLSILIYNQRLKTTYVS
jgi:hypothetical protein